MSEYGNSFFGMPSSYMDVPLACVWTAGRILLIFGIQEYIQIKKCGPFEWAAKKNGNFLGNDGNDFD
jgi:hypothetical protein